MTLGATQAPTNRDSVSPTDLTNWLAELDDSFQRLRPLYQNRVRITAALRDVSRETGALSPDQQFAERMLRLDHQRRRAVQLFRHTPEDLPLTECRTPLVSLPLKQASHPSRPRPLHRLLSWLRDPLIEVGRASRLNE